MKESSYSVSDHFSADATSELLGRLDTSGGRPTDPTWDLRRTLPISGKTYDALNEIAAELSSDTRKVSPMQVAAFVLEKAIFDSEHQI